jgi:hypothetical protein
MQAFEAYYSKGNFVPFGIGFIPEGAKAIVTVLNEFPCDMQEQLRGFDALLSAWLVHRAGNEVILSKTHTAENLYYVQEELKWQKLK